MATLVDNMVMALDPVAFAMNGLALHRALYYPGALVLLVSPSLRQSGELFRKVADLLAQLDHKPELTEDNRLSLRLANGSRVISLPSKEGTIRGFSGVDLIIEDESSRVPDELYRAVRPSWRYPVAGWS